MPVHFSSWRGRAALLAVLAPLAWAGAPAAAAPEAAASQGSTWPQGGYDAGWSFNNRFESALDADSVEHVEHAWGEVDSVNTYGLPVVGGGRVFICSYLGGLRVQALGSGKALWTNASFPCGAPTLKGSLVIGVGRGYPSGLDTVTAADQRTGSVVWQVTKPITRSSAFTFNPPVVSGGTLFVSHQWSDVYAFSVSTGQELWHVQTQRNNQAPSVADGRVFLSNNYESAGVLALDAATGRKLWRRTVDESPTWYPPAVSGGRLFMGTVGGRVYALNPRNGQPLWSRQLANYQWAPLVVGPDTLYAGMGQLSALDVATGATRWTLEANPFRLVLANGLLYFGADDARTGPYVQTVAADTGQRHSVFGQGLYGETLEISVAAGHVLVSGRGSFDVFALPDQSSVRSRQISGNSTTSSILRR